MIRIVDRRLGAGSEDISNRQFRREVLRGLLAKRKKLSCKYLYDEVGSELFEQITRLEEYYPTRIELEIMADHAGDMAALLGPRCLLIEYGSGSSAKTRLLLDNLRNPAGYVPIDVSGEFLRMSALSLAEQYPALAVIPLEADFTRPLVLPVPRKQVKRRVVYFPGSTIGNFTPKQIAMLLQQTATLCGPGGGLILGVDLRKDPHVIEAAYNDARGVTAAFNRNILARINRELDGNFCLDEFAHRAFYNGRKNRIEMHLVSGQRQKVRVAGTEIRFAAGESICTEYSYKFDLRELFSLAQCNGFTPVCTWTDKREYFCVCYFSVSGPSNGRR